MTQWISLMRNGLFGIRGCLLQRKWRDMVVCYGCQHPSVFPSVKATAFKLSAQWSGKETKSQSQRFHHSHTNTHAPRAVRVCMHVRRTMLSMWWWWWCRWCWWAKLWCEDCLAGPSITIMELQQLNLFLFATGFHSNTPRLWSHAASSMVEVDCIARKGTHLHEQSLRRTHTL